MAFDAVLFDIDGTLVDSNEQHVDAWAFAFREAGHPQELNVIRGQIGKGGDLLVPTLLPNASKDVCARISERHGGYFKEVYLASVRPFRGATSIIERVYRNGQQVVLASSAKRDELDHYVDLLGVCDCLAATTSSDDVDASKPAPDIFAAALERVGIDAGRALVIGDTRYDIEAAARAGVAAIGLTSGPFDAQTLKDEGAIAVYADVNDLLDQFDRSPLSR